TGSRRAPTSPTRSPPSSAAAACRSRCAAASTRSACGAPRRPVRPARPRSRRRSPRPPRARVPRRAPRSRMVAKAPPKKPTIQDVLGVLEGLFGTPLHAERPEDPLLDHLLVGVLGTHAGLAKAREGV